MEMSDDELPRQKMRIERFVFNDENRAPMVMKIDDVSQLRGDRPIEDLPQFMCEEGGIREAIQIADEMMTNEAMQLRRPDDLWDEVNEQLFTAVSHATDYISLLRKRIEQLEEANAKLQNVISHRVLPYDI